MGPASFIREIDGGHALLAVSGELDVSNVRQLRRHLDRILEAEPRALMLDLSALDHMDSSGLAELILAERRASERGVRLVLVFDSDGLRRMLEVRGLDSVFMTARTRDEAGGMLDEAASGA